MPHEVDLTEFDDLYDAVEPPMKGQEEVPDGVYQVVIDSVELKYSKVREDSGGNPMLVWRLRVISPLHEGATITKRNMIITDENVAFLKGDLQICGLHLERFSHLPARLSELLDIQLEVKKATKGEFTNVYFNKRITVDTEGAEEGGSGGEDDLPF